MPIPVESAPVDRQPLRNALALAFAVLAWLSAVSLWQLQDRLGPHQQRVNVRFVEDVSVEARHGFEQQHGLLAGEARERQTWVYRLTDQSPTNIAALLQSPLVEDTAHLDPSRLRVTLDQPGLHPQVRELLEREWLPYGSWLLALVGLVLVWSARSSVAETPRALRVIAGRLEALTARQEVLSGLGLCVLFLTPILLYGPTDDEELALGMFSSQIYYRDLLHGRWSYWFSDLGFGTPMPLGHRLDFHPVFALGSFISLRAAVSAVWIVHVGVMALYFRRLLAAYGLPPPVRLAFFALYLFSFPSILLFYTTDWVSCLVPWTLYPVLLYYVRDAVMGAAATRWWLTTVRLSVLLSLWVLNAHPGYLVPLFIVLAAYTLTAARPTLPVYGALATAGAFALASSAERIYFLVHEKGVFPAIARLTQVEYRPLEYLVSLAPPLTQMSDGRQPFVGTFVFGAAVAAPFLWRTLDRHLRGCIIAFFVALALSVTPVTFVAWTGLSGAWLFRDPMVFFGLLSAAAVAQSALAAPRRRLGHIALVLVALQGLQQVIVIAPDVRAYWQAAGRLEWYRHQERPAGVGAAVVRAASRYGKRLYLSPRAFDLSRGHLSPAGVHAVTDYALLGFNPVNAWFKNVAMDRIHPSSALMHGLIPGQRSVIENALLLDVLGINVVVAMTEERLAPTGLIPLQQLRVDRTAWEVDVFANPDAWPEAVLLSPGARAAALPLVAGCEHAAALCRDYTALAHMRLPGDVALREVRDGYRVHVPPSDTPRLLFVSAFYRPEWVATSADARLAIEPIANAFIGVTLPQGIQDIELAFRPRTRIALTWLSALSLVALLAALGTLVWRRRAASAVR